jgi:hypothetical protein
MSPSPFRRRSGLSWELPLVVHRYTDDLSEVRRWFLEGTEVEMV